MELNYGDLQSSPYMGRMQDLTIVVDLVLGIQRIDLIGVVLGDKEAVRYTGFGASCTRVIAYPMNGPRIHNP